MTAHYIEQGYKFDSSNRLKGKSIFECPADTVGRSKYWISSYAAVNVNLFPHNTGHYNSFFVSYEKVKHPSTAFAIMDGRRMNGADYPADFISVPWFYNAATNGPGNNAPFRYDSNGNGIMESLNSANLFNRASDRHSGRINILYVDNHAANETEGEFVKQFHWVP